ncbi:MULTISPECIES: neutral zinc metallopeptidase [unclassified Actinotalea]|uniref:KPN_02809 family neutral zinc metallopeptidase n=1 Tax=unclassified Actinotalea TaxID=2638618 RepID=UPI0015F4B029|nr:MULTISPECIES: neutral zinc metallopeptidase [unclassified Actinotalea]
MTFSEGGRFEGGRVGTRRRRGGAVAGGGIGLGIVAFLIFQFTGVDVGPALEGIQGGGEERGTVEECSAEEANTSRECRLSATVQSLDAHWAQSLPAGATFVEPDVWAFEQATSTQCGNATASTGPFYCPPEQAIYLDLGFYDLLESQFGATGGPLAEMYVTAHEYGHHIQALTGVMDSADRQGTGATSDSVRVELQADCYSGVWAGQASSQVDPDTGTVFLEPISPEQLAQALSAAEAVGDDHIQQQSGGDVNPHTWTHGSAEQRQRWFMTGYESLDPATCDTFAATDL